MALSFLHFIILLTLTLQTSTYVDAFKNNVTDERALLSFKASITDDPLGALDSWNHSIHFCHWNGVTCSTKRQRVTALDLSSQHLVGTLSPHIGNLSFIRAIDIHENDFHGSIPNEIGRLFRLEHLILTNNSFGGEFPANLSHCVNILRINMLGNNLKGILPTWFGSWPKLYRISFGNNHFTGSISPSIGNISNLRFLNLGHNNLVGDIPSEVAHHTKLEILVFQDNSLSGMVPVGLYNISSLYSFSLSNNDLEGKLPADWGFTLPKLQAFFAWGNRFSGPLSPSIGNASNLVIFQILDNNITGPIPNNLGSLPNLQLLSLGKNPLGDNLQPGDLSFFNSLVNCTQLRMLDLEESRLRGELPKSIVNLSDTMERLNMYENQLYGKIPHEIGKLKNMRVLALDINLLTGSIPESIGELSQLGLLNLGENNISGVIPTSMSNITQLFYVDLYDNMLQGSIPTRLFNISTLQLLDLASNRLRGVIPEEIRFSSQFIFLNLSQNLLTGPLPSHIGSLKQLAQLDVSYNILRGDIPATLGGCVMLEELLLEGNLFEGRIPSSFKALQNLAYLDLSNNNFSGSIPRFFDGFPIIFLNLSHNQLGGEVSREGLFSNVSAFSVVGNSGLCGGIRALHFPACPVKVSRSRKKTFSLKMILLIVLVPLGILLACLAFIFLRRRNSKKLNDPVPVLKDNQFPKLSYQDLLLATNEFSPDNLLGEGRYGSVYRGVLESGQHIVSVKVLHIEVRGANKSFLAECETLRNIRHRNLIKIVTACSSTDFKGNDFKALVFEFMTNGSVDSWLHPSPSNQGNERNLNLLNPCTCTIFLFCITPMALSFLHFIILLTLTLQTSTYVDAFKNNVTDQRALLSFKASITDDPLGALDSWNHSIHFCHWNGVTCSTRRQRVTALNLSSQHLVGTLSPHIGNLTFIRVIDIHRNEFHGSIPNEIGRLFRLEHLSLTNNSFGGEFPANLSHCVNLLKMSVSGNNLEGKLTVGFSSWSKLYDIRLGTNHFTGSIPPSIGNISNLRILHLGGNNLVGGIPSEIAHHTKLEILVLQDNSLSGMLPLELYNISSLHDISLANNDLEGKLPADWSFTLPKLQTFNAWNNRFSGPLSPSIANVSNLVVFDMADNSITGPIPNNLGSLPNLEWLNLGGGNPLEDNMQPDDLSFFNSLVNCTQLRMLSLDQSSLRGDLPNSIVNLSDTMEELYLYGNNFYGSIPHEIGRLKNMRVLGLQRNLLTGTIPESIGELSQLGVLSLGENNISGVIPTSISNITQLNTLFLHDNMLQGSIPTQLFNISTLQQVDLASNRLRGVIPEEIGFFSQCFYLNLSQNLIAGPLPSHIGSLKQLASLDVSYNILRGDIPATLGGCVMVEELYMQGNLLEGRISSSFKPLKNLAYLDLSNNNFSGSIPRFFDGFPMIFLNLSHNKLGGEVSREGLFSNISSFSVDGNSELCGGIEALHLPACPEKVSRSRKKTFSLRIILLVVLVHLGILLACLGFICLRHRSSKKLNDPVPVLNDNQFPKLSYQDLLLATNEFSPNNLLGEGRYGSVYKGVLESGQHIVAVKVLNIEVRGANKSFLAECETLRNIRHRNLIKIITACSSIDFKGNDFKALVFEFMTNESVDSWLHPSPSNQGNERNLNLLRRLNIAIDVAIGVDYLHHHSHASIIHSDIKPSNILLDEDFVAHIGDFGLARFSFATAGDINQAQMSSTGVRGTVGYVPPEYGMCGEISTEGDVYSYGILLLELFSGKRPTESSILIDGDCNLHDYVRKALPQRVMDIADPRIVLDQEEHGLTANQSYNRSIMEACLASIFEVGILCSEVTPQKRIDISVAIQLLNVARDKLLQRRQ